MLKKILAFIAISYATASAGWNQESAQVELDRVKLALATRMETQGKTIPPNVLLEMYAFYKQATTGDMPEGTKASGPQRIMMKQAWAAKTGTSIDDAVAGYKRLAKETGDVE